jgi:glycosyltransferase involved in cell wall biosynthesis
MKILHVSSGHMYGGIETALVSLARLSAFCPEPEHHFALCFEGRLSCGLNAFKAPVYLLGEAKLGRPLSVPGARKRLQSVIRKSGCDVVICHGPRTMVLFASTVRAVKRPLVMWAHGVKARSGWLNWLLRRVPPDLAICNSRYTREALAPLFPLVESKVIHHPMDMKAEQISSLESRSVRAELDTPSDSVVIVQASRMVALKGHRNLIDALADLETGVSWRCWIAGGAQSRAEERYLHNLELQVQARGLADRVRFIGQRDDIPRILSAADIFCQPNQMPDSFGIVFIEAMLAGLPVVTTAMGAASEVVNQESGVLVEANNRPALTTTLHQLITDPAYRRRVSEGGAARARQLCDPSARLSDLHSALEKLLLANQASSKE